MVLIQSNVLSSASDAPSSSSECYSNKHGGRGIRATDNVYSGASSGSASSSSANSFGGGSSVPPVLRRRIVSDDIVAKGSKKKQSGGDHIQDISRM